MRRSVAWGAGIAALVIGAMGAVRLRRGHNQAEPVTQDSDIATEVWSLLCSEFGPKAEDFSVSVRNGHVTLRGDVASVAEIQRYGAKIEALPGVVSVNNLLHLRSSRRVLHGETPEGGIWLS